MQSFDYFVELLPAWKFGSCELGSFVCGDLLKSKLFFYLVTNTVGAQYVYECVSVSLFGVSAVDSILGFQIEMVKRCSLVSPMFSWDSILI